MIDIIIWVTDKSTGEDRTVSLSVTSGLDPETAVERWLAAHPDLESSGWDYDE